MNSGGITIFWGGINLDVSELYTVGELLLVDTLQKKRTGMKAHVLVPVHNN